MKRVLLLVLLCADIAACGGRTPLAPTSSPFRVQASSVSGNLNAAAIANLNGPPDDGP